MTGSGAARRIKRKTADQLGFERVGKFAGVFNVASQVFFEWHKAIFCAVDFIQQLHFADRRANGRNVQPVFVFQVADFLDLGPRQLHHVFNAVTGIDPADAVILQANGRKSSELLDRRLLVGRFVGKSHRSRMICG